MKDFLEGFENSLAFVWISRRLMSIRCVPRSSVGLSVGKRARDITFRCEGLREANFSTRTKCSVSLRPIFESPTVEIVNQNIKYDLTVLSRVNFPVATDRLGLDPMVGDYLLDAGARTHNLDVLIGKYLGLKSIPISDLIGSGKQQKNMIDIPVEKVAEYATEDADLSLRIAEIIGERLKAEGLFDLYWQLERPLIPILAEMEQTGIRVDANELRRQSGALTQRLDETIAAIYVLAGHEFNIDSPIQLRKVLFVEQKLPIRRRTQTGPSTDQDVLEELALIHALPAKITEHRHLSKLKGTYLDALPELIHPETGRIHCSFNQVVAATGRLSSSDPNLQNIPIRTPEGRLIRKHSFRVSRDGNWFAPITRRSNCGFWLTSAEMRR